MISWIWLIVVFLFAFIAGMFTLAWMEQATEHDQKMKDEAYKQGYTDRVLEEQQREKDKQK